MNRAGAVPPAGGIWAKKKDGRTRRVTDGRLQGMARLIGPGAGGSDGSLRREVFRKGEDMGRRAARVWAAAERGAVPQAASSSREGMTGKNSPPDQRPNQPSWWAPISTRR